MVEAVRVAHLPSRLEHVRVLVSRISFEHRSTLVAAALAGRTGVNGLAFASSSRRPYTEDRLKEYCSYFSKSEVVELDTSDPLLTARSMFMNLERIARATGLKDVLVDITSFRREELLMLLAMLRSMNLPRDNSCELVYVGAARMGDWLSGDVTSHRSVIGFPGEMWPSRRTQLVLLMGFEIARARSIIENYEPADILLGVGRRSDSISDELYQLNREFARQLHLQSANVSSVFEFSARDPVKVAGEVETALGALGSFNVILAPIHTKLSTVGAGLFAQRHPEVQVCYAAVSEYNEQAYSVPGETAYVLRLNELLA